MTALCYDDVMRDEEELKMSSGLLAGLHHALHGQP